MVCTIRGFIGRMVHPKPSEWGLAAPRVLDGYRLQGLVSAGSLFPLRYGVSSGLSFEQRTHANKTNLSFHQGSISKHF